jgi:hypothetical protein
MNGNDSAYPSSPDQYNPEFGLTKRELIAAMAMEGLMSSRNLQGVAFETVAQISTRAADALIERLSADPVAEGLNLLPMYSRELDEGLTDDK